jgi:hypothetical protein
MHIPIHTTHNAYYVAFHVERILLVNALGEYKKLYSRAPEHQSSITILQHTELVRSLLQSADERVTYEMRLVSQPNVDQPSQGRINVYCVVAMRYDDEATAQQFAQRIYHLFNAHFRDVVWVALADVAPLLTTADARHAVSLTRKSGFILSDRAEAGHPYGLVKRTSTLARTQQPTSDRMFYVSPFVASGRQAHALFDYMLQHPHSLTISMRLQRTKLSDAELRFCQDNLDTYSATHKYPQAVDTQLQRYQQIMNGALLRSYDLAALCNIDIVSPHFIPTACITLMGNLITQPSGGLHEQNGELQYHGGYDVVHHSDYLPVAQAIATVRMRHMPESLTPARDRLVHVVDVSEAAVVFHIPRSSLSPIPGMIMQAHRQLRPPSDLSHDGIVIGQYHEYGEHKPIYISDTDRTRHTYIVGQTGTGKSTVLKSMVLDDIAKGHGVCVIDPHGDLFNEVLAQIPVERHDDVIVVDPTQTDMPVGLNIFEYDTQEEREMAVQLFQKTIELLQHARQADIEEMGPVFWQHLRNNAYWVTQDKHDPGTIIELYNIFAIPDYYKRWQPINPQDDKVVGWQHVLETNNYQDARSTGLPLSGYINSKFEDFIFDTRLRLIFGQKQSTFNFFDAMNTQKIVLINLSRGLLSEIASSFMGGIILAKLQQAALKRAQMPAAQRRIFSIYVDEFQNYTSDSFVSLLSESRKYGIALTLANQFLAQIENERIIKAIMGNVGTIIAFRVGIADAEILHPRFTPEVTPSDLINLPNWHAYVSTQVHGQSRRPFSLQTIRPRQELDMQSHAAVIAQSKRRYGRLRSEVERVLMQSNELTRATAPEATVRNNRIHIELHPIPHEKFTVGVKLPEIRAVHGAGLSLWSTTEKSYIPLIIGLHQRLLQQIIDTPLETMLPMQQMLGDNHHRFHEWATMHNMSTLQAAVTLLAHHPANSERHGEYDYAQRLLAYQFHQSRPTHAWRDVVLTKTLAVALDDQQCAWIWQNRPPAYNDVITDVLAIAGSEYCAFLLKRDGTVIRYTSSEHQVVPDVRDIVRLYSGENFVGAVDAQGQVYIILEVARFAERIGQTPVHHNIQLLACGFDHVIAYDADQCFVTWGANDHQCRDVPSILNRCKVVALAAGYDRSFALDEDGRFYAWGNHMLKPETMRMLNDRGVRQIACYNKMFVCQTADGTWWLNNDQLRIPETVAAPCIERIVGNYNGDWLAIRGTDPLIAFLTLIQTPIHRCDDLAMTLRQVLNDAGMTTLHDIFQYTRDQLAAMPYFSMHADTLDELVAYCHSRLHAHQIPLTWPTQKLTIHSLVPQASLFGWYVPPQTPPVSVARHSINFDDDFFGDFFGDD